jgi:hypothetical protein
MTDYRSDNLVNEYCRIVSEGADIGDARLVVLRERMTLEDKWRVAARFEREADARFKEAAELEAFRSRRRHANDNSARS